MSHATYLELAAAAIDFRLDPAERAALEGHLSGCSPCRRRVVALRQDARTARDMTPFVLAPERAQRIWRRVDSPRSPWPAAMRLVALAALLALVALSALTVGATLLRRDDLSNVVPPPPVSVVSPAPSAEGSPSTTSPDPTRHIGFSPDTIVEVVVTDLRVRTEPTVDDARSAKLEPLLGVGTRLRVVEGPAWADDYEWYRVEAIGWPHRGWVAAGDHDGEPWIEDPTVRASSVAWSPTEEAIVSQLRPDAAAACAPRTAGLPSGAVAGIECQVSTALVARVGAYRFESPQAAATAYLERLSSAGIEFGSGDCAAGRPGDAAWSGGSGEVVALAGDEWATGRTGCFLDEYGGANVRATCGPIYLGILGRGDDLAALHEWVWREADQRGPNSGPGLCALLPAD